MLATRTPILRRPNGAPQLPAGSTGSIAHDHHWVVAALTSRPDVTAVGIDIEPDTVLTPAERAIIASHTDRVYDPLVAFVVPHARLEFNGRHDIVAGRRIALVVAFTGPTPQAAG